MSRGPRSLATRLRLARASGMTEADLIAILRKQQPEWADLPAGLRAMLATEWQLAIADAYGKRALVRVWTAVYPASGPVIPQET